MIPSKRGLSKYRCVAATSCSNGAWGCASASTMAMGQHYGARLRECGRIRTAWTASRHELLTTVDVEGGAGQGGIGHQVNGQSADVRGGHDPADRELGPQFAPPVFQLVSEQRSRQRGVYEPGGDEVDANR